MSWYNATALYGGKFKATSSPNTFELRVYTGGFAGRKTAARRAAKEALKFSKEQGYADYEILESRRRFWVLSNVDFRIQFRR